MESTHTTPGTLDYPKIRNIEAFPVEYNGQRLICLRDPTHFSEQTLFIHPSILFLLSLFDGTHSVPDIQAAYTRQFGEILLSEHLRTLILQLDDSLMLESERFVQARQRVEDEFKHAMVRPAAHAGTAYEADPARLRAQLDACFTAPKGPGLPAVTPPDGPIKGLIAPHIDFHRGGHCYAWAYQELAASLEADLFIIFGIGHAGSAGLFTMTSKDFVTPLGTMPTDHEFVAAVQQACPFDVFEDEFIHKHEHSIEFQVVFLQYLLNGRPGPMIVPILCGSFHAMVAAGLPPSQHPHFAGFVQALDQAIASSGKRVCLIAGVDLAHIGIRFGDRQPLTPEWLERVQTSDLQMLQHVERLDAEAFFQDICADQDRRRICGYPAIYTLLTVAGARAGRLIQYDQAVDPATQQAVTFASMVLR